MLKTPERRISGIQEESIEKGETILSDWETFTEREDRIQKECGESGETYRAEDDWSIAERQAEDKRRSLGNAQMRKTQYPPTAVERSPMTYLSNWTGGYAIIWAKEQTEQWERERYMEWQQKQQWKDFEENRRNGAGVEDETERSERRIRNSKEEINRENLIEQERIRVEINRRYEENKKRERRDDRPRTDRR